MKAKLDEAVAEYKATRRIYDQSANAADLSTRQATAKSMREDIEETFKNLSDANQVLAKLAHATKKKELEDEVIQLCKLLFPLISTLFAVLRTVLNCTGIVRTYTSLLFLNVLPPSSSSNLVSSLLSNSSSPFFGITREGGREALKKVFIGAAGRRRIHPLRDPQWKEREVKNVLP